ncbi:hypothetical protein ACFCX4_35180 [Kitasatospora sp. NPDC056327]|uniref:hypothetical protein n=1 Tax=Kitasatospora sp. NPDC056327 TaxID=3345785 RepID=UPI0035E028B0
MSETVTPVPDPAAWTGLIAARSAYAETVSPHYDEVLDEVAERVSARGSLGKADIGALLLWKRLRADTRWVAELMATPDAEVRARTGEAVTAVRDTSSARGAAARRGRAALAGLPGFGHGDALASAVLTAAAPDRMAVYDRHSHRGLHLLGLHLGDSSGRYARYIGLLDQLLATAPTTVTWTARDLDLALYWLSRSRTD